MEIPPNAHLIPMIFDELRLIIRSLRLSASSLLPDSNHKKELHDLANYFEKELELGLLKAKAFEESCKVGLQDQINKIRERHFNN